MQTSAQMLVAEFGSIALQAVQQVGNVSRNLAFLHVLHDLVQDFHLVGVEFVHRVQLDVPVTVRLDAYLNHARAAGRLCVDRNERLVASLDTLQTGQLISLDRPIDDAL
uniref:(northern house mosquito) hypothetical protein n=1 Tax=Culex pipiens TaxID=7175 RepID=A0A8D8BJ02_CULPI